MSVAVGATLLQPDTTPRRRSPGSMARGTARRAEAWAGAKNVRQVEMNVSADEVRIPQEVVDKLRARLGEYNFYQRHGIRI